MRMNTKSEFKNSKTIGWKLGEAADFLVNLLVGVEVSSTEVLRLAKEAGIKKRTLENAKVVIGATSRRTSGNNWVMTVPENRREQLSKISKPDTQEIGKVGLKNCQISDDWVSVILTDTENGDISTARVSGRGLRVKIGEYEIEIDAEFPADKMIEVLRGLKDTTIQSVSITMERRDDGC
jgi:hypothetical protein